MVQEFFIQRYYCRQSDYIESFTSLPFMFLFVGSSDIEVSALVMLAMNIAMITRPVRIHTIAKSRPRADLGALSP